MARALPDDGQRYEVLDGELFVTPAPNWPHQDAVGSLYAPVRGYVKSHDVGWALTSPADIEFSPRRLVQPDLFVVPRGGGTKPKNWRDVSALLLAVEVLSPITLRRRACVARSADDSDSCAVRRHGGAVPSGGEAAVSDWAGLTEMLTPTNGALMAVLLAADEPFPRLVPCAVDGVFLQVSVGLVATLIA